MWYLTSYFYASVIPVTSFFLEGVVGVQSESMYASHDALSGLTTSRGASLSSAAGGGCIPALLLHYTIGDTVPYGTGTYLT